MNKPIPSHDRRTQQREGAASLAARLRRARLKAAFLPGNIDGDPVVAALAEKGWAFRAKPRAVIDNISKPKDERDRVSAAHHQACCSDLFCLRAFARGAHGTTKKSLVIARRATPLGRLRIARRSGVPVALAAPAPRRRAPFSVHDLSAPLAAIAPNLAGAAMIFLFLMFLL